jgi:hypothetical protein
MSKLDEEVWDETGLLPEDPPNESECGPEDSSDRTSPTQKKPPPNHIDPSDKVVYVTADEIVIDVGHQYKIALWRCSTQERILCWAAHLTEKHWMTMPIMRKFIRLCQKAHGLSSDFIPLADFKGKPLPL